MLVRIALILLLSATAFGQDQMSDFHRRLAWSASHQSGGGGGGAPTYVNSGADFSGADNAYTTTWNPANGNTLLVWVVTASTANITLSDGEGTGNTYTADADVTRTTVARGKLFRCSNISGSGSYTLTVGGSPTTPLIVACEISGNRTLDTAAVGSNPSTFSGSSTSVNPTAFTTSTAATILVDMFGDTTGSTITISQTDATYTTRQSANNGSTSFVGAFGTRAVSSTASYADGWTLSVGSDTVAVHAAYK